MSRLVQCTVLLIQHLLGFEVLLIAARLVWPVVHTVEIGGIWLSHFLCVLRVMW